MGVLTIGELHRHPKNVLAALFASSAREAVLRLLMLDPLRAYYQRQIEGATGVALRAVQRELERMASIGLLYRREEGNRTYYQVDVQFPLFDELRAMVLKTSSPAERIRARAAMDGRVQLVIAGRDGERVLVVTNAPARPPLEVARSVPVTVMSADEFTDALDADTDALEPFLLDGEDLLGRRDDPIWGRIALAGYTIEKAKGVA